MNNFLLTESALVTGKYQTEVLTVWTEPVGRGPYIKDRDLIFPRNDLAVEVNKRFIIWLFKQHTLLTYSVSRIVIFNVLFLVVIHCFHDTKTLF